MSLGRISKPQKALIEQMCNDTRKVLVNENKQILENTITLKRTIDAFLESYVPGKSQSMAPAFTRIYRQFLLLEKRYDESQKLNQLIDKIFTDLDTPKENQEELTTNQLRDLISNQKLRIMDPVRELIGRSIIEEPASSSTASKAFEEMLKECLRLANLELANATSDTNLEAAEAYTTLVESIIPQLRIMLADATVITMFERSNKSIIDQIKVVRQALVNINKINLKLTKACESYDKTIKKEISSLEKEDASIDLAKHIQKCEEVQAKLVKRMTDAAEQQQEIKQFTDKLESTSGKKLSAIAICADFVDLANQTLDSFKARIVEGQAKIKKLLAKDQASIERQLAEKDRFAKKQAIHDRPEDELRSQYAVFMRIKKHFMDNLKKKHKAKYQFDKFVSTVFHRQSKSLKRAEALATLQSDFETYLKQGDAHVKALSLAAFKESVKANVYLAKTEDSKSDKPKGNKSSRFKLFSSALALSRHVAFPEEENAAKDLSLSDFLSSK